MSGGPVEMTGVVKAFLHVVPSSRKLPVFVYMVVESFMSSKQGQAPMQKHVQTSVLSCLLMSHWLWYTEHELHSQVQF